MGNTTTLFGPTVKIAQWYGISFVVITISSARTTWHYVFSPIVVGPTDFSPTGLSPTIYSFPDQFIEMGVIPTDRYPDHKQIFFFRTSQDLNV